MVMAEAPARAGAAAHATITGCIRKLVAEKYHNLFNDHLTQMHYGSETPIYPRTLLNGEYGTAISVGIRGRF